MHTFQASSIAEEYGLFEKKKTANFEGGVGYEENWSTIFRRICPQKSLYAIERAP
jgi:hypothetical protein